MGSWPTTPPPAPAPAPAPAPSRWERVQHAAATLRRPSVALPLMIATILIVWIIYGAFDEDTKDNLDPFILLGLGVVFALSALVTLLFTRTYSTRGIGIALTLIGDAVLYTAFGLQHWVTIDPYVYSRLIDLARAAFMVGAPVLFLGLVLWVVTNRAALQAPWSHKDNEVTT